MTAIFILVISPNILLYARKLSHALIINQSIIVLCPRIGLSLQTQHSPLYPLLSLPFPSIPLPNIRMGWQFTSGVFYCGKTHHAKFAAFLGIYSCGSFPLLSASHSLFRIWIDLKDLKISQGHREEVRRVDLTNWTLLTSPKFTTGVKYQFQQVFFLPDQKFGNSNNPSPSLDI